MGDYEHLFEVVLYCPNGFNEPVAAFSILASEAFVDREHLEWRVGPPCQELGEGDPHGEIDPKLLSTGEKLIGASAQLVRDVDVQRADRGASATRALRQ